MQSEAPRRIRDVAIAGNERLLDMASRMGDEDRRLFPVDARRINWEQYIRRIHLPGLEAYALQERKLYSLRPGSGKRRVA